MSFSPKKNLSDPETRLFIKRWLKNPGQLGTIAPISKKLAKMTAQIVAQDKTSTFIIETGAGTGRLTEALIEEGIHPSRLICVELDFELYNFLKNKFPNVRVLHGDAGQLSQLLKANGIDIHNNCFQTIISSIPLMYLKPEQRLEILYAGFDVLSASGRYLQITYSPISPLKDLESSRFLSKREGALWNNIPPAFVWNYRNLAAVNMLPLSA